MPRPGLESSPFVRRLSLERPTGPELRGRARSGAGARWRALHRAALPIAQCTIAAPIAWVLATHVVGHSQAFFAPIAAIISLGVGLGERRRRTVELTLGVALGIGVANGLVSLVGTGPGSIALVVALGMTGALLLGGGSSPLLITQAAVAGVLVATIQPPTHGPDFSRFIDALLGGGLGLAVTFGLPADPLKALRGATEPVLTDLAGALRAIGAALDAGDGAAAEAALTRARNIDDAQGELGRALAIARDVARLAPARRGARAPVERYERAMRHLDRAVRNSRVLARAAIRAIGVADPDAPGGGDALEQLARAAEALQVELADGDGADDLRAAALEGVHRASQAFSGAGDFSAAVLLGQVRSTAVDLLRAAGFEHEDATADVREAGAVTVA
jgi:uncharacterized membrane protein YgaE (UPF0421/DUF939 family)